MVPARDSNAFGFRSALAGGFRRFLRFLTSPPGAATLALAAGIYWGSVYLHSRATELADSRVSVESEEAAPDTFAISRTSDGWRVGPASGVRAASYTVSHLDAPARHTWLAAPIRRVREVDVRWSPLADDAQSTQQAAGSALLSGALVTRSTGSEIERREALAALASWLEDPIAGNMPQAARFLRDHPDGRSADVLVSGYVHTGVLAALAAALIFSLAHSPRWLSRSVRTLRLRAAHAQGRCAACGYSVEGLKASTCPECGDHNPAPRARATIAASPAT
jgi:hypothetical protein